MPVPTPQNLYEYYQRLPTTDLYFRHPVRHLRRKDGWGLPPIRHIANNVYLVGRTGVICRYATVDDLRKLQKPRVRQIVYVADDDFAAGASDESLPAGYRARLAAFVEGAWPILTEAADVILVPNELLANSYGDKARVTPPLWHRMPVNTRHFLRPKRVEIVHLGTGSHRGDLAPIAPAIADVLSRRPDSRLTLFSGANLPEPLQRNVQVRSFRAMPWWLYKRVLARMRFHLAVYPLRESPFNAARSANKLYEHALVGGAGLMTPNPALRASVGSDLGDLFVEGGATEWGERIANDLADLEACRARVERTRSHIIASDPRKRATSVWLDILSAELS